MELCNISTIKYLLEKYGFKFSKALGQNFLTASWVPERIAEESGITHENAVLEIGPGIGCLTKELAQGAGKVVAVELDKRLPELLAESLADFDNIEIISGDILKLNIKELVETKMAGFIPAVCANLPYNITTPVLSALIDSGCFETITVMVQREVARRICSKPGSGDYGAFTVYANYNMSCEILFDVSPGCFMPQPKVHSSVIKLTKRSAPPAVVENEKLFFRVVKASFAQRRKTLVNALAASFTHIPKEELAKIITDCGFDERIRGETLDIPSFALISDKINNM